MSLAKRLLSVQPAGGGGGGGPAEVTYQGAATSGVNAITYTFTSQAIGAASSDRIVVVGLISRAAGTSLASGTVTIDGVSAPVQTQAVNTISNSSYAGLFSLAVPTGTTATVEATLNVGCVRAAIGVWTITGASLATAADFDSASNASNSTTSNVSVLAGGSMIGVTYSGGDSPFWTVLAQNYAFEPQPGKGGITSGASADFASASTPTVTCSYIGNSSPVGVFAAWDPA